MLALSRALTGTALALALLPCTEALAESQPPEAPVVTVTATRTATALAESTAKVTVLDREQIEQSAALTVDDLLRRVPGFNLFRRQSSLAANPTTQGVSLRGIGPNGAGRTLVLLDGIPINDPFGGWVYWSRIPTELIERIEVVHGGGSSVWGSAAMGGVINIVTHEPGKMTRLLAEAGLRDTANFQAVIGTGDRTSASLVDAAFFNTGGYPLLRGADRGAIDEPADSRHGTGGITFATDLGPGWRARATARYFAEDRGNGTEATGNKTKIAMAAGRLEHRGVDGSATTVDAYATVQRFEAAFSRQEADRSAESPALDQFDVPSQGLGLSARHTRPLGEGGELLFGVDAGWINGKTREDFRNLGAGFTRRRLAGARRYTLGAYAQALSRPTDRLELSAALRVDHWSTYDGRRFERDLENGLPTRTDRTGSDDDQMLSPRIGAVWHATDGLRFRASGYRGFRVPTLNELYRPFRVRNDITEANPDLDVEKLWGADLGLQWLAGNATLDLTGFWNRIDDAVANVTIAPGGGVVDPCGFVPDGGVCRQRLNLGETRTLGLEAELLFDFERGDLSFGYLLSDSTVESAAVDPSIEGNRLPQVPKHQLSVSGSLSLPGNVTLSSTFRWIDDQFEDDANSRSLDAYAVVDATASKKFDGGWELFVRAQNLTDARFDVAETADGVRSLGAPFMIHGGVRFSR